jgi:hypothetical protein
VIRLCRKGLHLHDKVRCIECARTAKSSYYRKHAKETIARSACWRKAHPESYKICKSKWQKRNPGKILAETRKHDTRKLRATPPWLTRNQLKEIQEFYILVKELQWLCNEQLQVDHIVPLQGKNVCGLHVPWNLQILPKSLNCSKNNKLVVRFSSLDQVQIS